MIVCFIPSLSTCYEKVTVVLILEESALRLLREFKFRIAGTIKNLKSFCLYLSFR